MQERKALGKDFDEDKLADDKHGAFVEECKRAGNWQRWWWSFGYDSSSGHDYLFTRSVLEMRGTDELVYELSIVGEDVTCTQTFKRVHWPCQNFPFGTECWNISLLRLGELSICWKIVLSLLLIPLETIFDSLHFSLNFNQGYAFLIEEYFSFLIEGHSNIALLLATCYSSIVKGRMEVQVLM